MPDNKHVQLNESSLGKASEYKQQYDPSLLFTLPRQIQRESLNIPSALPFHGFDHWTCYELSWLNAKGKPQVAIGHFSIPCDSSHLIESKSFKLYLNSFNNTHFNSLSEVEDRLQHDLSAAAKGEIFLSIEPVESPPPAMDLSQWQSLDHHDINCHEYHPNPHFLSTGSTLIHEKLYSNLLKSNCPVTGQPDWASIMIEYSGNNINHVQLLQYIVSYRDHNEFHEHCVEQIFLDISRQCAPNTLSVYARYTRRGGLDINPYRSSHSDIIPPQGRVSRQ